MSKFLKIFLTLSCMYSITSHAVTVSNVKVVNLYVQSLNGLHVSDAHAVRIDKTIDDSCGGRLHIDAKDKEIFSTILAYKLSGSEFNIMYAIGDPSKVITGHLISSCKLLSIY